MPELTIQMSRPDPFDPRRCGDGEVRVHPDGLIDKVYALWNRNPITVSRTYTSSWAKRMRRRNRTGLLLRDGKYETRKYE